MKETIACPHCTYLNSPKRVKCSMCLRLLRKRERTESVAADTKTGQSSASTPTEPTSASSAVEKEESAQPERPAGPVATQSGGAKLQDVRRSPDRSADSRVPTLFSTAAGRAVTVSKASLQKAHDALERAAPYDESERAVGQPAAEAHNAVRRGNSALSPPDSSFTAVGGARPSPVPDRVVSTLFSTAAGTPIEIDRNLLQKARKKLESLDDGTAETPEPPRATGKGEAVLHHTHGEAVCQRRGETPTACTTAPTATASATAQTGEAPLSCPYGGSLSASHDDSRPSDRLITDEPGSDAETTVTRHSAREEKAPLLADSGWGKRGRVAPARGFQPPKPLRSSVDGQEPGQSPMDQTAGSGALGVARTVRKKFVPPQQSSVPSRVSTAVPLVPSSCRAATTPPRPSLSALPSAKLCPLAFDYKAMSYPAAAAVSAVPSAAQISSGAFRFSAAHCGRMLLSAMGAQAGESHITPVHWRTLLLSLGASPSHCTEFWCSHMLVSSLLQLRYLACAESSPAGPTSQCALFTPTATALLLCLRYNREVVEGERPLLRKIVEGDVPPASLMTLAVSAVTEERVAPHVRVVELTDGCYRLKVSLDIPLSTLLREGRLRAEQRLAVCGARLLLHGQQTPEECVDQIALSINYNCVRAVSSCTPLGVSATEPAPLPAHLVHPQGGMVPALSGTVVRVLPPFYVNQTLSDGTTGGGRTGTQGKSAGLARVTRNKCAQLAHYDRLTTSLAATPSRQHECDSADGAPLMPSVTKVSRVLSVLLKSDAYGEAGAAEALIQHWDSCTDELVCARGAVADDDTDVNLPKEGTRVVVYALKPAKGETAAAPFSRAKLFYSSRALHFTLAAPDTAEQRSATLAATQMNKRHPDAASSTHALGGCVKGLGRRAYLSFEHTPELSLGGVVDVVGLFIGTTRTEKGLLSLLLLSDSAYALLQTPLPSSVREILLPMPTAEGTLVLVEHATFLTHEDVQAGSDCARVFANEYTKVSTRFRRVPGNSDTEVETLRRSLTETFQSCAQKYSSRRTEIFRCCAEEGSVAGCSEELDGEGRGGKQDVSSRVASVVQSVLGGDAEVFSISSATAGAAERRLPYYLRGQRQEQLQVPSSGVPRGVVFSAKPATPDEAAPRISEPDRRDTAAYHFYGNVVSLKLVFRLSTAAVVLFQESANSTTRLYEPPAPKSLATATPQLDRVVVEWRYDLSSDVASAAVVSDAVLDDLLEPCLSMQKACVLCSSECNTEAALQRSSVLGQYKKTHSRGGWWTLLQSARVIHSAAPDNLDGCSVVFLAEEWHALLAILREKTASMLFKFTLDSDGCIAKAFHVAENCPVARLFA